jgi:hypothetical protein
VKKICENNVKHQFKIILREAVVVRCTFHTVEDTVAQLVEALRFKPEFRLFDSRWCHWNFSLT